MNPEHFISGMNESRWIALIPAVVALVLAVPLRAQSACAPDTATVADSAWRTWSANAIANRDTNLVLAGGFDVVGDSAVLAPIRLTPVRNDSRCRRIIAVAFGLRSESLGW